VVDQRSVQRLTVFTGRANGAGDVLAQAQQFGPGRLQQMVANAVAAAVQTAPG